jgi:hypothetical protein
MKILATIITFIAIFFLMVLVINKPLIKEDTKITPVSSPPLVDINQNKEPKSKEADRIEEKKVSFIERLSEKGPKLLFDMYGKFKNDNLYEGYIIVFDTSNGKQIQKIIINNNFPDGHFSWDINSFEYNDHTVQLVDINFDGYLDLRLLDNEGATGNNWYATYLYDPRLKKFKYHKQLSSLSGVNVDDDSRQIITYERNGWCAENREYYKIVKDRLILTKAEWTEMDRTRDKEVGEPACFKYTGKPRNSNIKIDPSKVFYNENTTSYMRKRMIDIKEEVLKGSLDGL